MIAIVSIVTLVGVIGFVEYRHRRRDDVIKSSKDATQECEDVGKEIVKSIKKNGGKLCGNGKARQPGI